MATSYTSLLGLALPVTGELAGTWGDTVNNSITSLLDTAVAGTTTLSTDADVTLTTTTGASNQARQAILLCSGARTALRTITAPAQSKIYVVINNTTGGFGVKLVGAGPTTGITVAAGKTAVLVWNGSDFVEVAPATATTATNLAGGAAGSLPYQSGAGATTFLSIGTANRVLTSSGTAPQWSNSLSGLTSIVSTGNITGTSLTIHPTLNGKIGANTAWIGENSTATVAVGMYQAGSGLTTIANLNFISSGSTIRGVISCTEESGGDAAYLAFSTRNAAASVGERMRITSAGNVGIGTAAPTAKLDVRGSMYVIGAAGTRVTDTDAGNGFEVVPSTTNNVLSYNRTTLAYLPIRWRAGVQSWEVDNVERMRIDSSGNVGIGTTSVLANTRVHIAQNSDANYSTSFTPGTTKAQLVLRDLSDTGTYTTPFSALTFVAGSSGAGSSYIAGAREGSGTSFMAFGTGTASIATERMRINSAGNVGIGTNSPSQLFHISSGDATALIENTAATSNATLQLKYPSRTWALANRGSDLSGAFAIRDVTAGADRLVITSAGNVGIGSLLSDSILTVASSTPIVKIRDLATAAINVGGAFYFQGYTNGVTGLNNFAIITGAKENATAADGSGYFSVQTSNSVGSSAERMRITSAGNVGIGTASPVNKLQVDGSFGRNAPVTKTGNFTLADTENWLICNGTATITVTLPAASSWTGREVMIKTIAAFTVVSASSNVVPLAGGAAGTAILAATAGKFATLVSDGTNWIIMQAN